MLLVVVDVVYLVNFEFIVAATFIVVLIVCVLHASVLLLNVHTLAPDLVISIGLVGTVVFVVGTGFC